MNRNIMLMPYFKEQLEKIISNYNNAKQSGDSSLINEIIDFDFMVLMQQQCLYLEGLEKDGQALADKNLSGIEQGNIYAIMDRRDLLEDAIYNN